MNHALEEWLMDHTEEDCFLLWRNETAILLGKNQNAYAEVDMDYIREHNMKLVRRITGGGTVFTDPGNIMFSFISCNGKDDFSDFKKFTTPILRVLRDMGIEASFSGRNDLEIHGQKFSGNAQCRYKDKVLHHGTLMYNADVSKLAKALKVKEIKLRGKGVSSVRSRVTNIADHMYNPMDIEEFRSHLFHEVKRRTKDSKLFVLSDEQWEEVYQKSLKKHATPQWIYGKTPSFNVQLETKLSGGIVEVYLDVKKGRIHKVKIYGDFFSHGEIKDIEKVLEESLYERDALKQRLSTINMEHYFTNISGEELLTALI